MNSFVIADPQKCIGCRTCEIACVLAHSSENLLISNPEFDFNPRLKVIKTAKVSAPIQCRHCEDAPCAKSCPNSCITNNNGVVDIDTENCIGCKACMMACPFGAMDIVSEKRMVANKCDLCSKNQDSPACINVCPTQALKLISPEIIKESVDKKRKISAKELIYIR